MTVRRQEGGRVCAEAAALPPGGFSHQTRHRVLREPDAGSDLTWGVGAVSSRLSVTASTLRTWERRYGVGPSFRTQGGHRRYTELDIDRVELMRRLLARGISARDAARVARTLDHDALELALTEELNRKPAQLAAEDSATPSWPQPSPATTVELSQLLAGLLRQAPGDRGVAGRPRADPAPHVVGNRQRVTSTPMRRPRRRSSSCASCTP